MKPDLSKVALDPSWHLFYIDVVKQTFQLARLDEATYRATSFLDARALQPQQVLVEYNINQLVRIFSSNTELGELGLIFHIGHCGSTLLSRALSTSDAFLPVREPLPLLVLSNLFRELDKPTCFLSKPQFESLKQCIVNALKRRFNPDQLSVIKLNSTCNNLIAPLLDDGAKRRAVCLYLPLESYLTSMLSKDKLSSDVRGQAITRMQAWMQIEDVKPLQLHALNPIQLMVVAWLTNLYQFTRASTAQANQVKLLNFEDFLGDPELALSELCVFFGKPDQADVVTSRYASIAGGYSKNPSANFDANIRKQAMQLARHRYAADISQGMQWAQTLIAHAKSLENCGHFLC